LYTTLLAAEWSTQGGISGLGRRAILAFVLGKWANWPKIRLHKSKEINKTVPDKSQVQFYYALAAKIFVIVCTKLKSFSYAAEFRW
jgi:hypothetical protein